MAAWSNNDRRWTSAPIDLGNQTPTIPLTLSVDREREIEQLKQRVAALEALLPRSYRRKRKEGGHIS